MASFVTCKYVNSIPTCTILDLGWLPIIELRDYSLFKTIFKALYSENWPSYLNLQVIKPIRHLRSDVAPRLYVPFVQGTFQHSAAMIVNELPANILLLLLLLLFITQSYHSKTCISINLLMFLACYYNTNFGLLNSERYCMLTCWVIKYCLMISL